MADRRSPLERAEELARILHGPRTKVVVYRDPEIGVWCADLMSGGRFIASTSTTGMRSETVLALLQELKDQVRGKGLCPTCGLSPKRNRS